jgi:hypothetical protein
MSKNNFLYKKIKKKIRKPFTPKTQQNYPFLAHITAYISEEFQK